MNLAPCEQGSSSRHTRRAAWLLRSWSGDSHGGGTSGFLSTQNSGEGEDSPGRLLTEFPGRLALDEGRADHSWITRERENQKSLVLPQDFQTWPLHPALPVLTLLPTPEPHIHTFMPILVHSGCCHKIPQAE